VIAAAIERFLATRELSGRIAVAISGGGDSTALLLAMAELKRDVVAAHVNHHLRGEDSDADEQFVRELCATLEIRLHVADGSLDVNAVRDRGVEAAAREVRHVALHAIARAAGAVYVATAHHRDDQAETVLMRLYSGGGIAALRGIHAVRDDAVIRPLLDVRRRELAAFVASRGITPRHDTSNDDPRFLRNRVRAMLREAGDAAVDNLARLADQANAQWRVLERAIDAAEHVETSGDETRFLSLPDDPWLVQALLQRHIRRLEPDARDVSSDDLARLASGLATIKRTSVTKTLEVIREDGVVVLRSRRRP
jgi:tRNA(Ile)-lysidine synthetase-like protein